MDATQVHLLTNHIPILGSIFGFVLLIAGMIMKNSTLEKTGLVTIVFVALMTIPVFLSGEEAEHAVENLQGVSEHELEEHEEHAELSLWIMMASGVLSLISLITYYYAVHLRKMTRIAAAVVTFMGFITLIPLADHGGKIMHQELRENTSQQQEKTDH
ncbi:MAG: hypothetical protein WEC59_00465 [Salibacteraceae bacterium]